MKPNQREKGLMIVTVAVIAGALVYTLIVEPQIQKRDQLQKRLNELELKALKINQDLSVRDHIEKRHAAMISVFSKSLEADSGQQVLSQQISTLCREHGLKMRSMQGLPVLEEDDYQVYSLKLDLQGYIDQMLKFIAALEQSQSPLRIVRFDLETRNIADAINVSLMVTKVVINAPS